MPQLHCYVSEDVANQLQQKAEQMHLSLSKYLALLARKDTENQWPEDYFELFGSWEGDALQRPEQLNCEQREELR